MNVLFDLLRCPETGQRLLPAEPSLIARLHASAKAGTLRNQAGVVPEPFESALITLDGSRIYPVRDGIPVLLIGEAL
jgi:uncharacterized protein